MNPQTLSSKVIATGSYLPSNIVKNSDLAKKMATSDEWIQEKIGIKQRHYASVGQTVADFAFEASVQSLKQAHLKATDLDAIIFATTTSEYQAPGSGVLLQNKLGCKKIPAFDVRNTSPGFLFSLDLADGLIQSGRYKTILVVGSELHSTVLDFSDKGRMMSVIFGDGAGCFILQATQEQKGFLDFALHSDGKLYDQLWYPGKDNNTNASREIDYLYPQMDGRVVFENAVKCMSAAAQEILQRNHLQVNDIDLFISHQANLRIIKEIAAKLNLPLEKFPHNIETVGNTSSASIPILFDQLNRAGKIKSGQKILLFSFGSGFSWGAGLLQM